MKRALFLVLLVSFSTACSSLPDIQPTGPAPSPVHGFCRDAFPRRAWRMVHSIRTQWPGGRQGVMIGVVSLRPAEDTVECALLSIEGLRLFEARDDGRLTVRRALPPFDRPVLAEGMMQDIRLLFFPPPGPPLASGQLPTGEPVCRYHLADGTEDIMQTTSGKIVIARYDGCGRMSRRATIARCHPEGAAGLETVACRIRLEAFGPSAYRLELDLVEARPVLDKPKDGP